MSKQNICKCTHPRYYCPHVINGSCRFCFGYKDNATKAAEVEVRRQRAAETEAARRRRAKAEAKEEEDARHRHIAAAAVHRGQAADAESSSPDVPITKTERDAEDERQLIIDDLVNSGYHEGVLYEDNDYTNWSLEKLEKRLYDYNINS